MGRVLNKLKIWAHHKFHEHVNDRLNWNIFSLFSVSPNNFIISRRQFASRKWLHDDDDDRILLNVVESRFRQVTVGEAYIIHVIHHHQFPPIYEHAYIHAWECWDMCFRENKFTWELSDFPLDFLAHYCFVEYTFNVVSSSQFNDQ